MKISDTLLGEILVGLGHIQPDNIEHALQAQRQSGLLFGQVLIQLGVATWEQVQAGLRYQDNCRHVAENTHARRHFRPRA